jgi:hypothetical protein
MSDLLKMQLNIFEVLVFQKLDMEEKYSEDISSNSSPLFADHALVDSFCQDIIRTNNEVYQSAITAWDQTLYKKHLSEYIFGLYLEAPSGDMQDLLNSQENKNSFYACYTRIIASFAKSIVNNPEFWQYAVKRKEPIQIIEGDQKFFSSLRAAVQYYEPNHHSKTSSNMEKQCAYVIKMSSLFLHNSSKIISSKNYSGKKAGKIRASVGEINIKKKPNDESSLSSTLLI